MAARLGLRLSGCPSGGRVSPRWRQGTRPLTHYHCREGAGKQQQGRLLFPWRGSVGGERVCKAAFAAYPHRKGGGSGIPRSA